MHLLNRGALIGAVAALLTSVLLLLSPSFFGLENLFYDAVARKIASADPPDPRIVLVIANDKSIKTLSENGFGRWPFSREVMARVIDEARVGGAKLVVFDITFDAANSSDASGDGRFAEAMRSMPVVLAAHTAQRDPQPIPPQFVPFLWRVQGSEGEAHVLVPPFGDFVPSSGIATARMRRTDNRGYVTFDRVSANGYLPSLAVASFAAVANNERRATYTGGQVHTNGRQIPVDADEAFLVRWRWHGDATRPLTLTYPAIDLDKVVVSSMMREIPEEAEASSQELAASSAQYKDKIVIVGAIAQGTYEFRETPVSPRSTGVEIHANALDNLLNGEFNRRAPFLLILLALLTAATLLGAVLVLTPTQWSAGVIAATTIIAWAGVAYLAHAQLSLIIPSAAPLAAFLMTYGAVTVVEYVAEQKRGVQLRGMFGRYVSPQILTHILDHPDRVELGGERREMTVLFSDIRGFTSISETTEPEDVVEMLNEYLTDMVEILLRYGGTLDKFIGDAVMGFWNAPTDDPQHAFHAVECAIDMIAKTAELRERWETEGKAAIRIGIGINSGEAVVGNIGSRQVFGYTVIGDTVNLASRLESKNKDYATEIIVSEMTLERIPAERYDVKYLDEVKVKGKERAVRIYEIKGRQP